MKTTCVRRLLTIMVVLCALHPAWAAWTSAVSMGTTIVLSDPSCASPLTGLAVCAARGVGQTLIVNQWNGTKWAVWKTIAGTVTSNPSCAADGAGNVICGECGTVQVVFPQPSMTVQAGARSPELAVPSPRNLAALISRWGMCYAWAVAQPVVILRAFSTARSGAPSKLSPEQPFRRPVAAATVPAAWSAFPHRRPMLGMSSLRALLVLPGATSSTSAAALAPIVTPARRWEELLAF